MVRGICIDEPQSFQASKGIPGAFKDACDKADPRAHVVSYVVDKVFDPSSNKERTRS